MDGVISFRDEHKMSHRHQTWAKLLADSNFWKVIMKGSIDPTTPPRFIFHAADTQVLRGDPS